MKNHHNCGEMFQSFQAAMRGYADIVRHLAHAGADVNAVVSDGTTALLQAAYVGIVDEQRRDACATVVAVLRELGAVTWFHGDFPWEVHHEKW